MKTICKVATAIIVAALVLIGGCAALIGAGVDEAQKQNDKTAITAAEFSTIGKGDTLASVKAEFGAPSDAQTYETDLSSDERELLGTKAGGFDCIYYGREGSLADFFQICFDGDGNYESKARW